ncbi:heparan-alpha-glucosaminide N-acetyltransferase [Rhizobium sp. MC63]|uniref:Heparan-alpha-glucosaminide N-acetyltransferase n=1 Tax=Rhizobium mulingense TaxID=3031128 RepID=A0ACC6MX93_9HYPH|nr:MULTISPECIES: heparan-alpha-glucosaminide N-acetyltransferase [unclassified Rhizobium]MDF0698218.1 heparan-alpha-glucosaminide N-acetyltransferase [Rhizobium sp. MC63]MEA3517917.1 heparan-alpha-glucosaminide N-acetyltransferase [Rhizobium sp. MJ31]MEB3043375.1 heparan-alpha-glucosaminide N-acetyltransferase [Rhizobium sp. MJ21]
MTMPAMQADAAARPPRIGLLDTARGIALIAMASYHFSWDMEFMGYLAPGTAETGWLKIYARAIATTFLFIVGVSLVLSSTPTIRWPSFWKRFGMIAAAAAAISIVTRIAMPDGWIYFGILHCIAVLTLIGIVFIRLPLSVTLVATLALLAAWITDNFGTPGLLRSSFFDPRCLAWIGLAEMPQRSNDYVPLFPWATPFFAGLSIAAIAIRTGLPHRLAALGTGSWWPARLGRHSLAFYLIHQPVLIAIAYGLSLLVPPPKPDPAETYLRQCNSTCVMQQGEALCRSFCKCTLAKLQGQNLLIPLQANEIDVQKDERVQTLVTECSAEAE